MSQKVDEQALQAYIDGAIEESLGTETYTEEYARECVAGLYELMEIPMPELRLFDGPGAAWDWAEQQVGHRLEFVFPAYTGCAQRAFFAAGEYLYKEHGVELEPAFVKYLPVTNLCMVWPLEDVCMVSQPPKFYRLNDAGELHCESGPAMEFRDGSKVWCIDGIDVDEQIVMDPASQTIDQMVGERNTDVRAIRIQRYGWLPFLQQTSAEVIEERENVVEGTYEALFSSQVGNRFIATCNTGRIISLGVPSDTLTCEDAQLYLRGNRPTNIIARS